jgi:hypothetical protein
MLQGIEKQGLEHVFGCVEDVGANYAFWLSARCRAKRPSQSTTPWGQEQQA